MPLHQFCQSDMKDKYLVAAFNVFDGNAILCFSVEFKLDQYSEAEKLFELIGDDYDIVQLWSADGYRQF